MNESLPVANGSFGQLILKIADLFENLVKKSAAVFCWSTALLVMVIICNVILRYGFNHGLILFEEIQWHLYAIGIMFGLSYAEITNSQVRVDVVAHLLKPQTQIKWEIFGSLVFVFPMIFVVVYNSIDYVAASYALGESSVSPLGLPYRWLIKAVIPVSFILFALAVMARLFRNVIRLTQKGE
ncbi:MAG: TRAP transporter small permease subunit [Gammaproteobacteria bacterium]|nr:TRAP transporter small permease subunit [Gammaproteobacteria bacterium]